MSFPRLDFDRYHRETLPLALDARRGCLAARAVHGLGSLAFRLREGGAYSYRSLGDGIEISPGDASADTVIELDHEAWEGLVHELEAPAGLLYAGRLRCVRGHAMQLMAWEAGLRALYNGRPLYEADRLALRDRSGRPLDIERSFTLEDEREELRHFLDVAGYLFVRGVFGADEVAAFRLEAEALRGEARKGDKLSWWGKNASGEEILCRVTRADSKPKLATLASDPRLRALADLASQRLVSRKGEGGGVTVIYKHPQMVEGLGDLPWHRDCGMGGHAVMCPVLIASIYLSAATPETGTLAMLPASHRASFGTRPANYPGMPRTATLNAQPGDVSIHYGDTMHAAAAPTDATRDGYRISAIVGFARPDAAHHRGEKSYNDVLHGRDDGQVEHLERVAERT
jgi:ectoine hydroxylase-related dioxygenase (phytanoyl-CoA dioxygenase family)